MSDDLVKKLRREAGTLATMYSAADEIERLRAALEEARLQIEYLHDKFRETGSGNAALARIDAARKENT
jgi:hypothetical protein